MKYSVVIPAYNNPDILNNTLEALNDQIGFEAGGYEVIVVDDGSPCDLLALVQETPRTYPFRFVRLERMTVSCRSRVRNSGAAIAVGDVIVFLDSDMIVAPNYMQELDAYDTLANDLFVFSNRFMLKEPVSIEDIKSRKIFQRNYKTLEYLEGRHYDSQITSFNNMALVQQWMPVYSCSMALPRHRLEQIGGFHESYKGWGVEDWDVAYRCMKLGMRIVSHLGMEALHQYHGEVFGDLRTMERMIEWDRNITNMYRLHPTLEQELPRRVMNVAYFMRRVPQMMMRKERGLTVRRLEVRREADIPGVLAEIEALSAEAGNLIIVRDAANSTLLHLRIQLLGFTKSEIRYYPAAYELDPVETAKHFRQVFTWKKRLILIYRSLKLLRSKWNHARRRELDAAQ
jgi:glycosyltransferase involved in cell wall biosynthesis